MADIKQQIAVMKERLKEVEDAMALLEEKRTLLEACPFHIAFSNKDTRIVINKLSELHQARVIMKELFGSPEYVHAQSFYSCGVAIATFCHATLPWAIWLECQIFDFPKELMPSEDCHWQEVTEKSYNMVCQK
jgi:hypothetical protein